MASPPQDNVQLITSGPAFDATGLVHRVRVPANASPGQVFPTLVMVHGLQGNEDVTWIFARQAGPQWLIVSPRAPFPDSSGYSWYQFNTDPDGKTQVVRETFQTGESAL